MITKQRIKQQCSIFDQSPISNKNGENTRSHGAQLNKSDHFLRSAKYSSYLSDSTQNFKKTLDTIGLKSLLNLSNRIYSEPDLLYFKNQLSRRTNLKYRSLQHLTTVSYVRSDIFITKLLQSDWIFPWSHLAYTIDIKVSKYSDPIFIFDKNSIT